MLRVASFDIGKKNFAFTVWSAPLSVLADLPFVDPKDRYTHLGTPSKTFQNVLHGIHDTGELEHFHKTDLTMNCDPKSYLDPETFHNMNDFLSDFNSIWDTCQIFLVERQMSFKRKYNTMALKLGQHCLSYFILRYGRIKYTLEFPAYYKTQVLGAPKKMSYPQRKKWAVKEATNILFRQNRKTILQRFEATRKKDDISDCVLQTIALLVLLQQDQYPLR